MLPWLFDHAEMAFVISLGNRTPVIGSIPVAGRPGLFRLTFIALAMFSLYSNWRLNGRIYLQNWREHGRRNRDQVWKAKRKSKRRAAPNGAAPFELICDMEDQISKIEMCSNALRVLRNSEIENCEKDAIELVVVMLDQACERLAKQHTSAFRATWGFKYGIDVQEPESSGG
jgi:ribosomal protein L28